MKIAVSACLLGEACRYDGLSKPCEWVCALRANHDLIPVCPEVAGGLPTPRTPCEIVASERVLRVVDQAGVNRTEAFLEGAQKSTELATAKGCQLAILKAKSPSCGSGLVYDGSFTKTLISGYGATATSFREQGIRVVDEQLLQRVLGASAKKYPQSTPALLASASSECPVLETDRLVLRAITPDDVHNVFAYCSNPDVGVDAGWPVHRSIDDSHFFINCIANEPHVFGIFEKLTQEEEGGASACLAKVSEAAGCVSGLSTSIIRTEGSNVKTGPCIGSVGLAPDPHRKNVDCLMLGYALGKAAWGKGYMTEAAQAVISYGFEQLGLKLITANHFTFNDRSRRVIEKCGFVYEGMLHGAEMDPHGVVQDFRMYMLESSEPSLE